jgi:trehalose synthase
MGIVHVPVAPVPPDRFAEVLGEAQLEQLRQTIASGRALLADRVVWNVNSTARGGGVAEMLVSLLAYARGVGIDARWVVIEGGHDFFAVTKRIHNMLHGSPGDGRGLTLADDDVYRGLTAARAAELAPLVRPGDVVILHDPQTAGLIEPIRARGAQVVWRCHVGMDGPDGLAREAWRFLLSYVRAADAVVFSRDAFVWEGLDPAHVSVIPPSIDAFAPKNEDLGPATVEAILAAAGIAARRNDDAPAFTRLDGTPGRVDRCAELIASPPLPSPSPAIVQVSRWDRLKDPLGVLEAFSERIAPNTTAHLVLAGPASATVADDPEAEQVLSEVARHAAALPSALRERIHLLALPMEDVEENAAIVNALQRRADVVVQKSLAEGFGLTVAEAMWKARPVVASDCGGIREQIVDGESGLLVGPRDLDAFAAAVTALLDDPARCGAIGARAREDVRHRFLGPRHLRQYVDLFARLLGARPAA